MENNYDNSSEENFLPGQGKKNSFVVPEGYFDSLSARILNKIEHEQELAEFKTLSATRQSKFAVPQNYFSSLANILKCKYELSVFPELSKVPKPILKSLPDGYFENLDKKVADKMEFENELKGLPILSSIEKKNSFKLVPDYFENSTDEIKEKIYATDTNSENVFRQIVITLFKPQMAIAASLILIVGISTILYFNRKDSALQIGDCKTLACLEKNELLNENNINDFDDENLYDMVDVEILDKQMSDSDSLKMNKEK